MSRLLDWKNVSLPTTAVVPWDGGDYVLELKTFATLIHTCVLLERKTPMNHESAFMKVYLKATMANGNVRHFATIINVSEWPDGHLVCVHVSFERLREPY